MSSVNHWIEQYGVLGVFLTAAAEGEIGVLVGGAMAHLGRLSPVMVALAAWAGSLCAPPNGSGMTWSTTPSLSR